MGVMPQGLNKLVSFFCKEKKSAKVKAREQHFI
jgi:hypothetical protein